MPTRQKLDASTKLINREVRLTQGMWDKLKQLAQRREFHGNRAEVIRAAIREYLARQEDMIGSRAHFQKTFRERIDELEENQDAML